MDYKQKYDEWLNGAYFDDYTKDELRKLSGDEKEIEDRFYKDLDFGTGGLRGVIGAGTNRMNVYTVRKATQGLADYILAQGGKEKGVAIAFDNRRMSTEFADETALCMAANGIKAYVFESLRPTPELSFAVRTLGCISGVVITASHNPPEYNGYKAYWSDGAQVNAPRDREIIDKVNAITNYEKVLTMPKTEAIKQGLYITIGADIDDAYMAALKGYVVNPKLIERQGRNISVVYTPLHGTGNLPARRVLRELGFENVFVVPEQEQPDPNFSTVSYPNPEDPKVFALALTLAKEKNADLILATDPDADRLGVYALDSKSGEYMRFTGNMSAMIIAEYILSQRSVLGLMPENPAMVTTIVSTNLAFAIARNYGVKIVEVLTGFKNIGEQMEHWQNNKQNNYVFGFEESYGCLVGTHCRDKDAIAAVMSLCEAAAYYKENSLTLWDQMQRIYEKYGYYSEDMYTITLKGIEGAKQIEQTMEALRHHPPKQVGGFEVVRLRDYKLRTMLDIKTGEHTSLDLPASNVLYFDLADDAWCCVRPSGTEPKIKFYMGVKGHSAEDAKQKVTELTNGIKELI